MAEDLQSSDDDGCGHEPKLTHDPYVEPSASAFKEPVSYSTASINAWHDDPTCVAFNSAVDRQLSESLRVHGRDVYKQPWDFDFMTEKYDAVAAGIRNSFTLNRLPPSWPAEVRVVPAQTFLRPTIGKAFSYVTKCLPKLTWPETKLAIRDRAYKLWRLILEENFMATSLGKQIQDSVMSLASEAEITSLISDTFLDRAPSTLAKRGSSMLKYMVYCRHNFGVPGLPVLECRACQYVRSLIDSKAAATTPSGFVSALNFSAELLDAQGAAEAAKSARIRGAAQSHFGTKRILKQAKVLKTEWVTILESAVYAALDPKDKIAAGFFCFLVHARPRFSDAMFVNVLELDVDKFGSGFVEGGATDVKTARSAQLRTQLMPLVAPAHGIAQRPWAAQWFRERELQNVSGMRHLLPSVGMDGNWVDVPCDLSIANRWLVSILQSFGVDPALLAGVTSQGLKATSLSWCAKFGMQAVPRQLLGHHIPSHLTSAMTYSRDCLAAPLREYDEVLLQIRLGNFQPDCSRGGRFVAVREVRSVARGSKDVSNTGAPGDLGWHVTKEDQVWEDDKLSSESEESSSSEDSGDSDDDLAALQALQKPRPSAVVAPPDSRFYLCNTSKLLHLRGKRVVQDANTIITHRLRCGKLLSGSYRLASDDKIATYSKCINCFASFVHEQS